MIAESAFTLLIACLLPKMPRAARGYLAALCALCLWGVLRDGALPVSLAKGLSAGAFLASVFLGVGFMGTVAARSGVILRCGAALVHQAPGRRYAALSVGGHLLAILLNVGALSLLGTMIERAMAQEQDLRLRTIRHRRMILALLRAFCAVVLWSPMSIGIAFVLSALPSLQWADVGPYGLAFTVLLLAMGWIMDRLSYRPPPPGAGVQPVPWRDVGGLLAVIMAVFGGASVVQGLSNASLMGGIIVSAPLVALAWRAGQGPGSMLQRGGDALWHGVEFLHTGVGRLGAEVSIIGLAAVLGAVGADFIPAEQMQALAQGGSVPAWGVAGGLMVVLVVVGQVGLNPVISIPLLLPSVQATVPPGSDLLLALACLGGWTLCLGSSPLVSTSLIISRHAPVSARVIGHRWNGLYTLLGVIALLAYLMVLDQSAMFVG
jgi:hypothetical protein